MWNKQIVKCNGRSSFYLSLLDQTQHNICTLTQTSIWEISIFSTVWFYMMGISFRWGDAPVFKPKPKWLSSIKLICAMFSIVRDNALKHKLDTKNHILAKGTSKCCRCKHYRGKSIYLCQKRRFALNPDCFKDYHLWNANLILLFPTRKW